MLGGKMFHSVLLKLSGEALGEENTKTAISASSLDYISEEIKQAKLSSPKTKLSIVIGGGNIWRGAKATKTPIDRVSADAMGMLATIINALALRGALEAKGLKAKVLTSINISPLAEMFTQRKAIEYLEDKNILIFAGGTGSPFFTTDTGSALRAAEIGAEVIFKATQVDGVYTADPKKDKKAKLYKNLSYEEALSKGLKVMDASALAMCMGNKISTLVFNLHKAGNIKLAFMGKKIGTIIHP